MKKQLLLISDNKEDIRFFENLCAITQIEMSHGLNRNYIRSLLVSAPQTVVFWNAENETAYETIGDVLPKYVKQHRLFAITQKPFANYTHLTKFPIFGHHLMRRYEGAALKILSKIVQVAVSPPKKDSVGINQFFSIDTVPRDFLLTRAGFKRAAVEAIQNVLTKQGVQGRQAALIAQSADELILNAIFDAPSKPDGTRTRWDLPRDSDFELVGKEQVKVSIASSEDYIGICVTDQFGTLKRKTVMDSLRRHFKDESLDAASKADGSQIGLYRILQGGVSLLFSGKSKVKTDAMMFFPVAKSYKEFRTGFHFLSVMLDS